MIRCSRVFSDNGQKNYRIASGMRIFYRMGCVTTGFCSSVAINSVVLPLIKVENELVGGPITDKYRYRPIYRLSADISVLPINKMLIGIGYWYRPIRRVISAG